MLERKVDAVPRGLLIIDIQNDYFPGYPVTVVADGCAAPDLEFDGRLVPGPDVQAAFLAALADSYATVVKAESLVG